MTRADEIEQACEAFLCAPCAYVTLVDRVHTPRIWCLRDADGVAVIVGDLYTLTLFAQDHDWPLVTVH